MLFLADYSVSLLLRTKQGEFIDYLNSPWRFIHAICKVLITEALDKSKPPLTNQQFVDKLERDMCDVDYVRYTRRQLFQRIEEHIYSKM